MPSEEVDALFPLAWGAFLPRYCRRETWPLASDTSVSPASSWSQPQGSPLLWELPSKPHLLHTLFSLLGISFPAAPRPQPSNPSQTLFHFMILSSLKCSPDPSSPGFPGFPSSSTLILLFSLWAHSSVSFTRCKLPKAKATPHTSL